jgi:hypothetical protein
VDQRGSGIFWIGGGGSVVPFYYSTDGATWNVVDVSSFPNNPQFEIYGVPPGTPMVMEPSTWILVLAGFGLMGLIGRRPVWW